jgi:hypothetical protein
MEGSRLPFGAVLSQGHEGIVERLGARDAKGDRPVLGGQDLQ